MNQMQQTKLVLVTPPAAIIDNAAVTTTTIDTLGYSKISVYAILGASDIAMTVLKLQESDDSGMSGAADVTGLVYGTSTNPDTGTTSALPTSTDDNKVFAMHCDLKGRKRYVDVGATCGDGSAGTYITIVAFLYNGVDIPTTATLRGLGANLIA